MVVFTCSACGDSVKRNQVQKHCERCRRCEMLSCIDCGKDFWGNDYEQHIKCVSEEEKYSGKNYVAKPNANKNELKQQQWKERVQDACMKYEGRDYVKSLLQRMKDYPNIPRTQKKFENFVKNCLGCTSIRVPGTLWDLLMADKDKDASNQSQVTSTEADKPATKCMSDDSPSDSVPSRNQALAEKSETQPKTLNKRERKEERRKKSHKTEKKEKYMNGTAQEESCEARKKEKKRKRKHESDDDHDVSGENVQPDEESIVEVEEEEPRRKHFKTSFNWEGTIRSVLESKGTEVKIKKLRRKVLAEYLAQGCTEKSEEKLWAKFDKKLKKNPAFKVLNDRVKLVS